MCIQCEIAHNIFIYSFIWCKRQKLQGTQQNKSNTKLENKHKTKHMLQSTLSLTIQKAIQYRHATQALEPTSNRRAHQMSKSKWLNRIKALTNNSENFFHIFFDFQQFNKELIITVWNGQSQSISQMIEMTISRNHL